jgi:tetratricopeptide (TPR) repeat protein
MSFRASIDDSGSAQAEIEDRRDEVRRLFCNLYCVIGNNLWTSAVQIGNVYAKAGLGGYSKTGDLPEQAIQYYERALAIDPMYRIALESVIQIRKETGRVQLSASHIRRMAELDSSYQSPTVEPRQRTPSVVSMKV